MTPAERLEQALALLRAMEWTGPHLLGFVGCVVCCAGQPGPGWKHFGHKPDCPLAAVLQS